jgi:phosphoribosyl 1,2-cyclic phosphate phosphodiesterase
MKLTFLGTGTSYGVPQIGCHCAVCSSPDPRDRRSRVSAVVEFDNGLRILIDTPPELRLQLIAAGIDSVDAVLYTHDHADHTHGIDDLRAITVRRDAPLPIFGTSDVVERMARRFPYIFDAAVKPERRNSRPEAAERIVDPNSSFMVGGTEITPLVLPHGDINVLGFRIGPLAYITDAKSVPEEVREKLKGVKLLVLNALLRTEHPTHLSFPEAIEVAGAVGAKRTYLTHLTHRTFHADLEAELPQGVIPAFDGLVVRVD